MEFEVWIEAVNAVLIASKQPFRAEDIHQDALEESWLNGESPVVFAKRPDLPIKSKRVRNSVFSPGSRFLGWATVIVIAMTVVTWLAVFLTSRTTAEPTEKSTSTQSRVTTKTRNEKASTSAGQTDKHDAQAYIDYVSIELAKTREIKWLPPDTGIWDNMSADDIEHEINRLNGSLKKRLEPFIANAKEYQPPPVAVQLHQEFISYLESVGEYARIFVVAKYLGRQLPSPSVFDRSISDFCSKYSLELPDNLRHD